LNQTDLLYHKKGNSLIELPSLKSMTIKHNKNQSALLAYGDYT